MSRNVVRWIAVGFGLLSLPAAVNAGGVLGGVVQGFELFDYNFSGERNLLGNGWTINANAFYNNRTFDFGNADLTLSGVSNISAGYTLRGIPALTLRADSGSTPMIYDFKINTGVQDFQATGSVLYSIESEINALGFYDTQMQISNRGTYRADGMGIEDRGTLDYDIGPIDMSGNLFADAVAAITQPFFTAAGQENPFSKFSAQAARTAELKSDVEELRARIEAGELLSDDDMAKLVNDTIASALLSGESINQNLFDGMFSGDTAVSFNLQAVPEPASALLLILGTAALRRRRSI